MKVDLVEVNQALLAFVVGQWRHLLVNHGTTTVHLYSESDCTLVQPVRLYTCVCLRHGEVGGWWIRENNNDKV